MQGRRGRGEKLEAALPFLVSAWSQRRQASCSKHAIAIAAAAFGAGASGQRVDSGARVGMVIETVAAACAATTPTADQQGAAEQVGPDLEAVVAVLVALGQGADKSCGFREEWELDRSGPSKGRFATFGHRVGENVTRTPAEY